MKYIFTTICLAGALITAASAEDKNQRDDGNAAATVHGRARSQTNVAAPARTQARPVTTQRQVSTAPIRRHNYAETPRTNANATARSSNRTNARFRDKEARVTSRSRVQNNVAVNRERNAKVTRDRNVAVNRDRNVNVNRERNFAANRDRNTRFNQKSNVAVNRNRNVTVTNNWRGSQFSGRNYAVFRDYHRTWHNRNWWGHHYSRIVFVAGGWWYWNAGYWFPAWGYDSSAYYPYDGPIYGYSNLTPIQVVSQVQGQLRSDGYYSGPIDGVLGPMTRQAIADFQADHGLAITSTVDEPTLDSLGIS